MLLVRFTFTPHKKQGRLCQDCATGQEVVLLKSLLSDMGPIIMTIVMTQYYKWHHPRPVASDLLTADKVQLKVVGETIGVSDWIRLGTGPGKIACCGMLLKARDSFLCVRQGWVG